MMINELKYRAWDKEYNRMSEVTQINLSDRFVNIIYSNKFVVKNYPIFNVPFSRVELMECLGVKDKKGKEVWEGDIVKWTYPNIDDEYYKNKAKFGNIYGLVYWNSENCSFRIKQISIDSYKFDNVDLNELEWKLEFYGYDGQEFEWNELEVNGNIYENKELYEEQLKKYKLLDEEV